MEALDLSFPAVEFNNNIGVLDALVLSGLAASNGEARRHIQAGAVRADDQLVTDEHLMLAWDTILSLGKKKHARLVVR